MKVIKTGVFLDAGSEIRITPMTLRKIASPRVTGKYRFGQVTVQLNTNSDDILYHEFSSRNYILIV